MKLCSNDSITPKQRKVIDTIEHYCNVKFEGSTKSEANEFIDRWIAESHFIAEEEKYIKRQRNHRVREFQESFEYNEYKEMNAIKNYFRRGLK